MITRVENVCLRLGLTPLAYLWRRDQSELLKEMVDVGMDSIIVKVACLGLTEKHLGKSLAEMQPHLESLSKKYGVNVCGEGGEYETFTLDCPLFKHRIQVFYYEFALTITHLILLGLSSFSKFVLILVCPTTVATLNPSFISELIHFSLTCLVSRYKIIFSPE